MKNKIHKLKFGKVWKQLVKKNPLTKVILFILTTLVIFIFLLSKTDLGSFKEIFMNTNIPLVILGMSLSVLLPLVLSQRWRIALAAIDHKISFSKSFNINMGIWPLNSIFPSKSGDLLRALILRKELKASTTVGTVFAERIFDILVLSLASLTALYVMAKYALALIPLVLMVIVIVLFFLSLIKFKLKLKFGITEKLNNIFLCLRMILKRNFGKVVFWTIISWLISFLQVYIFFVAVGSRPGFIEVIGYLPLSIFAGLLPITFSGIGTRDGAIVYLFSSSAAYAQSISVGILYTISAYWLLSLLGLPFMKKIFFNKKI